MSNLRNFLLCRGFARITQVKEFNVLLESITPRRVICGQENISWDEQIVPENSKLYNFFLKQMTQNKIEVFFERPIKIRSAFCWTSIYRENEYINKHKDKVGHCQAILCLRNDGNGSDGLLCLENSDSTIENIFLEPGDLVLFRASDTFHSTTPIHVRENCIHPVRTVAVCRYFLEL